MVPTNARIIAEDDVVVGGYKFPRDVSSNVFLMLQLEAFVSGQKWMWNKRDGAVTEF